MGGCAKQQKLLQRVNATQLRLSAEPSSPVRVFANDSVSIERQAVDELHSVLDCQRALALLPSGRIEDVTVTPDYHNGAGIPIGNNINCAMRLHTTSIAAPDLAAGISKVPKLRDRRRSRSAA
jgi:tRNA-splicing ligase RtcB